MREIPILFSAPMVRAILAGNKSMTRRVIKPQPNTNSSFIGWCTSSIKTSDIGRAGFGIDFGDDHYNQLIKCPYGEPGDRLWVKEAIKKIEWADGIDGVAYIADDEPAWDITRPCRWVWKNKSLPSMFMPRGLARIWLEVVSVRVERVQEITEEDAIHEGCAGTVCTHLNADEHGCTDCMGSGYLEPPQLDFVYLWDSINAKRGYGWEQNPWVWVVEFRRAA